MSLPVHLHPDLAGVGVGDAVTLAGDEARHAVAVRRTQVGERIVLTDGRGARLTTRVTAVAKTRLEAVVEQRVDDPEPVPRMTVVQPEPKGDRGELAVSPLPEIGAARIGPWAAERCVATWRGERADKGRARWTATSRESAKQARRSWLPEVDPVADLAAVVAEVGRADLAVVLHEAPGGDTLADRPVEAARHLLVVVGPEGGVTDPELAALADAGARTVRLGAEVLRTSTAGVAACAALLGRTERWR